MTEEEENLPKKQEEKTTMKPWEQHSAVISIPRFDYNAPTNLLSHSYSGFLITCPIKREKSATKEAMSILEKYIGSVSNSNSESLDGSDANISSKRRKLLVEEKDEEEIKSAVSEGSCLSSVKSSSYTEKADALSLVKLTQSGLVLLTFPKGCSPNVTDIVSNIMISIESRSLKSPLWCNRIFPVQATCTLIDKELCPLVSKLVVEFMNKKGKELAQPVKFAVGYNRRGFEETQTKGKQAAPTDPNVAPLLDRIKCFEVVASAVKSAISDSVVDLKCPELSVLIELLPLSGVTSGSPVVAVSVLSQNLVSTKPRLCIKALTLNTSKNGKKNQ